MKKFLILLKVSIQSMLLSSTHSRGRSRKKTATGLGAIVVIAGLGRVYRQAVTAFAARSAQSNYKLSAQSASSQQKALLRKETQRFWGTPMYFWNAGLGLIMLLAAGSASLEMREKLLAFVGMDGFPLLPVTAAVICFCLCTCPIAAPSVSLEGKQLWILREAPMPGSTLLWVKAGFQLLLTLPCTVIAGACIFIALGFQLQQGTVGKYQDHAAYLPECKEMVEQLSGMVHEILETSKLNTTDEPTKPIDIAELMAELCAPYQMIAAAHQIICSLDLPEQFPATLPAGRFSKAVSNVLANAVAYTEAGKSVSVYMDENRLIIENECDPIPDREIRRLFEPFYRPDFSRSRENGGNGLVLYIVDTLLTSINIFYALHQ